MEVKPGYKRTDAGVVPEDWQATTIGEVCKTSSGTTPSRSLHDRYYRGGDTHWVKTLDLNNSEIITTDERVTPEALDETSLKVYPTGTVLIAMYGGFLQIGRTGILRVPAAVNQAITAIQSKSDDLLPEFLIALLNYRVTYWKAVASSSRKDPNITSRDIKAFPVAYPSVSEQRYIAAAFSDVDALIESLDRLIAKKCDLKQAAMQQLLTGQTRLPGFGVPSRPEDKPARDGIPQGWTKERIGKLGNWFSGGTPSMGDERLWNGEIPWISAKDMKVSKLDDSILHVTPLAVGNGTRLLPRGALLMVVRGMILAHTFPVAITMRPMAFNQDLKALVVRDGVSSLFVLLSLQLSEPKILSIASESTHGTKRLASADFFAFEILLPPLEEQTAIAQVLSDMDAEIVALEARRDKTKLLKEGMMQELLTGRTRLV